MFLHLIPRKWIRRVEWSDPAPEIGQVAVAGDAQEESDGCNLRCHRHLRRLTRRGKANKPTDSRTRVAGSGTTDTLMSPERPRRSWEKNSSRLDTPTAPK